MIDVERRSYGSETDTYGRAARRRSSRVTGQDGDGVAEEGLSKALGWFSVGLGLTELAAPQAVGRWLGVEDRTSLIRSLGARELASGIGILREQRPVGWVWSRVAGDLMDLAALGAAVPAGGRRDRVATAAALVAGITIVDVLVAQRLSRSPGVQPRNRAVDGSLIAHKALTINAPRERLYDFWRRLENLPRIMKHLDSVRVIDERRSHWVARSAGVPIEWDAEIVDERPNERIAWRTTEGSSVEHTGEVRFESADPRPGTIIRVEMRYRAPGGPMAKALTQMVLQDPDHLIESDLRRLKQLMETGEVATTEGQPSGRRRVGVNR
jgi:uncharacterized membrane protein